jgi:hypothetical protein
MNDVFPVHAPIPLAHYVRHNDRYAQHAARKPAHLPGGALCADQPYVGGLWRLVQRDVLPDEHADPDARQIEAV